MNELAETMAKEDEWLIRDIEKAFELTPTDRLRIELGLSLLRSREFAQLSIWPERPVDYRQIAEASDD